MELFEYCVIYHCRDIHDYIVALTEHVAAKAEPLINEDGEHNSDAHSI